MKTNNNNGISKDIKHEVQKLKAQHGKDYSDCMSSFGVFWAFSNEQFAESKTQLEEGDKYVSIGAGGYMPKSKFDDMLKALKVIDKNYRQNIKRVKGSVEEIISSVNDYEGNIEDAIREFEGIYTAEYIMKVCNANIERLISS